MTPVAILSPGYPGTPGGVTDHTARLVSHWEALGSEVVVLDECIHPPEQIVKQLVSSSVSAILIQYVPFLYGRRGLSRFPERFADAARASGIRVTTFVHELWVPANRPKWWVLSPLQQRQLRRLLDRSDAAVTAVPAWQQRLGGDVGQIYVGCVLDPVESTDLNGPLLEAPVVFSPFAAGLNWEWISKAADKIDTDPGLLVVGADRKAMQQHPLVKQYLQPSWDCRGRLPADAVLETLSRARLVLAPFVDGVTGRRGSIAAALSVGAQILSSRGHLFDPAFEGAVAVADDLDDFASRAHAMWNAEPDPNEREERLRWFRENLHREKLDMALYRTVSGSDC